MIVDLGHGADRRARGAHRIDLIDRDGRRNALDAIDLRLVHAVQELARIGRERLDVAALPFGVQRVEYQRGFAGSGHASDDDQLVERQIEIEIAEVVLTRAAHDDRVMRTRLMIGIILLESARQARAAMGN